MAHSFSPIELEIDWRHIYHIMNETFLENNFGGFPNV